MATTIDGNLQVNGSLVVTDDFACPDGAIGDDDIEAAAEIGQTKQEHRLNISDSQKIGIDAASEARIAYVCYPAGGATLLAFRAGCITVAGAATTVDVDLKKNGTTMLSGVITLDSGNTTYVIEAAPGFATTTIAQGDVLSIHYTLTGANEPQGVFANVVIKEKGV